MQRIRRAEIISNRRFRLIVNKGARDLHTNNAFRRIYHPCIACGPNLYPNKRPSRIDSVPYDTSNMCETFPNNHACIVWVAPPCSFSSFNPQTLALAVKLVLGECNFASGIQPYGSGITLRSLYCSLPSPNKYRITRTDTNYNHWKQQSRDF